MPRSLCTFVQRGMDLEAPDDGQRVKAAEPKRAAGNAYRTDERNAALQSRLELAEARLNDRQIAVEKAGTLAEASLSLNGVFQAAEAAAQQYLENIEHMSGQQETICRHMQAEAEAKAAEIMREAQEYSKKTHAEADAYWKQIVARVRALLKERDALRELIQTAGRNEEK